MVNPNFNFPTKGNHDTKNAPLQKRRKTETRRFRHGENAKSNTSKPIVNACKINVSGVENLAHLGSAPRKTRKSRNHSLFLAKSVSNWWKFMKFHQNTYANSYIKLKILRNPRKPYKNRGGNHRNSRKSSKRHTFLNKKCVKSMKFNEIQRDSREYFHGAWPAEIP